MTPTAELLDLRTAGAPLQAGDPTAPDRTAIVAFLREEMRLVRPTLPETWPDAALFRSDLALDSLDLVELVARAEQYCRVYIGDEDLARLVSVDAMADYLCGQLAP